MTGTREQLLTGLRERIVAYAASRVGRDFAEDLAQEVLLVLEAKYGYLETVEDLVPVSFQILRFKMQDLRRKQSRRGEFTAIDASTLPLADTGEGQLAASRIWRSRIFTNVTISLALFVVLEYSKRAASLRCAFSLLIDTSVASLSV